jgi:hypothetical protein
MYPFNILIIVNHDDICTYYEKGFLAPRALVLLLFLEFNFFLAFKELKNYGCTQWNILQTSKALI